MRKAFLFLCFIMLYVSALYAQDKAHLLKITPNLPLTLKYDTVFSDTIKRNNELRYIENKLKANGYVDLKKISAVINDSNQLFIVYYYGNQWQWGDVKLSEEIKTYFSKSEYKRLSSDHNLIDLLAIEEVFSKALIYAEEHGYPFAEIQFDSVSIQNKRINTTIKLNYNQKVIMDSIKLIGDEVIRSAFLSNYLGLRYASLYDERKIKAIQNRVDELGFIRLKTPPQLYFINGKAKLVLDVGKRNANKFDGLIGVQPSANNQKTAIVGQINLYLVNLLKRGERLNVEFRSQANETRDLKLNFNYPYVLNLNFGVDLNLEIRRQDTSFTNIARGIALQYLMQGTNQLRLIYKVEESNLLSTKKYTNSVVLPDVIDVKKYSYGINTQLEHTDYRVNPSKGYGVNFTLLFGQRKIEKNSSLKDTLYSGLKLTTNQIQFALQFKKYIKLSKRNVLVGILNTKWIEAENLFNNELIRFGGINDLRGFNEESIFASFFWQTSLEYRFLIDRNSFFRLFYDQAYFYNSVTNVEDYPYGIGTGIQVQTVAGILQLSYALGAQNNTGLNFQTGKIHFGIINYF